MLEEENKILRQETMQLARETNDIEECDKKQIIELQQQLFIRNEQLNELQIEIERLKEENSLQHEQIINVTTRLVDSEMRLHQITTENEEQSSILCITKENQNALAVELTEFKTRYQEVMALLNETQEQLRKFRKKNQPTSRICAGTGGGGGGGLTGGLISQPLNDCLQFELMDTTYSDSSLDSGISLDRPTYKNTFDTVRYAAVSRANTMPDSMPHLGAMSMTSSSQPKMSCYANSGGYGGASGIYRGTSSVFSGSNYQSFDQTTNFEKTKACSRESLLSDSDVTDSYPAPAPTGTPGVPGAKDLEAALRRLTPAQVLARRAMLSHAPAGN